MHCRRPTPPDAITARSLLVSTRHKSAGSRPEEWSSDIEKGWQRCVERRNWGREKRRMGGLGGQCRFFFYLHFITMRVLRGGYTRLYLCSSDMHHFLPLLTLKLRAIRLRKKRVNWNFNVNPLCGTSHWSRRRQRNAWGDRAHVPVRRCRQSAVHARMYPGGSTPALCSRIPIRMVSV